MTGHSNNLSTKTGTFLSVSSVIRAVLLAAVTSFVIQYVSGGSDINTVAIFSGVLDLLAILAGFLATFYVFIITKSNAFIEKIKTTDTYRMTLKLLKFTIMGAVFAIVFSYVLTIINPRKYPCFSFIHIIIFFWAVNVFLVIVNFIRCARHFLLIAETDR